MRSKFSRHLNSQYSTGLAAPNFGDILSAVPPFPSAAAAMCAVFCASKNSFLEHLPFVGTIGCVTTRLFGGINCHRSNPFMDNGSDETSMLCVANIRFLKICINSGDRRLRYFGTPRFSEPSSPWSIILSKPPKPLACFFVVVVLPPPPIFFSPLSPPKSHAFSPGNGPK